MRAQLAPTAARVASAPKRAREAWLTGIARCGACGGPMTSKGQPERPRGYACREVGPGHVHIDAGIVEDAVLGMMLDRVAEHGRDLAPRITFWSTVAGVDEQIRDAERRQNMLASEFAAGAITQRRSRRARRRRLRGWMSYVRGAVRWRSRRRCWRCRRWMLPACGRT